MTIVLIVGFVLLLIAIIAVHDLTQRNHAVTRNFPVIGHFRYFFEEMGQPLRQYLLCRRPRGTPIQPSHAVLGVRFRQGSEQLRWLRLAGRS